MANYRKMFKEHYGIEFGPEYVVHHIDMNRENNEISNLMLLPKGLHAKYHMALSASGGNGGTTITFDGKVGAKSYNVDMLRCFADTLAECNKWLALKDQMDMSLWQGQKINFEEVLTWR